MSCQSCTIHTTQCSPQRDGCLHVVQADRMQIQAGDCTHQRCDPAATIIILRQGFCI